MRGGSGIKMLKLTTRSPENGPRWVREYRSAGTLLVALSSLAVVTCAGARKAPAEQPLPATTPGPIASTPAPASSLGGGSSPVAPLAASTGADDGAAASAELGRFFRALHALEAGERTSPVRILWLGDSHTAADFWTDVIRRRLQKRFGNGGPGFVHVGLKGYRHACFAEDQLGRWSRQPRRPSFWELQDDGVFGLAGMRTIPETPQSKTTLEVRSSAIKNSEKLRFDVAYRLPTAGSALSMTYGGRSVELNAGAAEETVRKIRHYVFEADSRSAIVFRGLRGRPELLGMVVETTRPGVVVDTAGINGARIATPLGWDAEAWVAEAERRAPELVVLAYGTNEIGDAVSPWRYEPLYDEMMHRVRTALPDADCIVVGPTDRARADWAPHPRVTEVEQVERQSAARLGCRFISAVETMGGVGSLRKWANQTPPLASGDRVHLTVAGYEKLGDDMATALLAEYDAAIQGR